jgi:hypothetical protein
MPCRNVSACADFGIFENERSVKKQISNIQKFLAHRRIFAALYGEQQTQA